MVTKSTVTINPTSVRSGDVFVVLDGPVLNVGFAQRKWTAEETPGPLSDDDIDRLANGDLQGFELGGMSVGCDEAQRAEDRGKQGYCGNVRRQVLSVGKYAFYIQDPDGVTIRAITVLEVLP